MVRALIVLIVVCAALSTVCMGEDAAAASNVQSSVAADGREISQPNTFTVDDRARLNELQSKKLHQLGGHGELAEFMRLRKAAMGGQLPSPADDIVGYALMQIGQPYKRKAYDRDLSEGDCVTFVERCIALACVDNWRAAHKLQTRVRYNEGSGQKAALNREPILDWIPANAWLFDEVTESLGVPVAEFEVQFENRSAPAKYVGKENLPAAYAKLQTGDILLVIAEQVNPPSDPELRVRCAHLAIIYKPSETAPVHILHSYPPAASQWPLERLLRNPHVKGGKFLRLKANARQIVAAEFLRRQTTFDVAPADVDNRLRLRRGQFGFLSASRTPDSTVDIEGVRYGVIQLRHGETLWSLFNAGWKGVCSMEVNRGFMQRHPNLSASTYEGDTIYYPISRTNGDKTPPPAESE